MNAHILGWLAKVRDQFIRKPGDVLEIGSLNINGTARSVFEIAATSYLGVDMCAGPGVDLMCNAHDLDLGRQFDTVLCLEMLEHDTHPHRTIDVLHKHAARWLVISAAANGFREHKYPRDYWRFRPDAFRELFFTGFVIRRLDVLRGPTIIAIGERA